MLGKASTVIDMIESELLDVIKKGEGPKLEFKRDSSRLRPEVLAKEIVAFANTHGGQILIGVEDDGQVSGIERKNLHSWIMDTVIGKYVSPNITPAYDEAAINDKKVAIVTVPIGTAKPYALEISGGLSFYVRRGNTCQKADHAEMLRLYESGGLLSVEKMQIDGCSPDLLNNDIVKSYLTTINKKNEEDLKKDHLLTLCNFDFVKTNEYTGRDFVTYFACAFFVKQPRRYLPQSGVRIIVYEDTKEYAHSETAEGKPPILDEVLDVPFLGIDRETPITTLIESYIKPYIHKEHLDVSKSYAREEIWDYPIEAIRELVVNAFAHRDWLKQNQVWITVYSDCMEITSPGALPNGMTVEKMKAGNTFTRNSKILNIMRDTGFMENRGRGISEIVIHKMKEHNGVEPIFEPSDNYFKVILPKKSG